MAIRHGHISAKSRRRPKKLDLPFKELKPTAYDAELGRRPGSNDFNRLPSVGTGVGIALVDEEVKYDDPELAMREQKAKDVKHTIMPICNKGAYQVITGADVKTAGRKV